jgi:hypothetical protein
MVRASNVDSCSAYSTTSSSSSKNKGDRCKSKKGSKNLSGQSRFTRDIFYGLAHNSGSNKSQKDDSDFDSKDEVHDNLSFLRQENEVLGKLLDNHDDKLREAKKMRKELRDLLEDAMSRVAELETQSVDAKLETDSLKASPIVIDEVDCADCSVFLPDLTTLREKHASKCEEPNVLRVELAELQSRPSLLGAYTSCPVLHGNIDELCSRIVSLETDRKVPIPTSISTCELHAVKNLEVAHYVDRLQDDNDEFRKYFSWLSGQEPQLGIMIPTFKPYDGQALGAAKIGESSGERDEKTGEITIPPQTTHKNKFEPKPNHHRKKLDTTQDPPIFPHPTNNFQKPVRFVILKGDVVGEKKGEKPSEEKPKEKPSEQP